MTGANRLPADFADLEHFVEHWDVATSQERWIRRSETPLASIRTFYDAMLARADAALSYLERYPLQDLPPDAACLMRLLLSMTQAAMAIELHDAARVPRSPFPHSISIEKGVSPYG